MRQCKEACAATALYRDTARTDALCVIVYDGLYRLRVVVVINHSTRFDSINNIFRKLGTVRTVAHRTATKS